MVNGLVRTINEWQLLLEIRWYLEGSIIGKAALLRHCSGYYTSVPMYCLTSVAPVRGACSGREMQVRAFSRQLREAHSWADSYRSLCGQSSLSVDERICWEGGTCPPEWTSACAPQKTIPVKWGGIKFSQCTFNRELVRPWIDSMRPPLPQASLCSIFGLCLPLLYISRSSDEGRHKTHISAWKLLNFQIDQSL